MNLDALQPQRQYRAGGTIGAGLNLQSRDCWFDPQPFAITQQVLSEWVRFLMAPSALH